MRRKQRPVSWLHTVEFPPKDCFVNKTVKFVAQTAAKPTPTDRIRSWPAPLVQSRPAPSRPAARGARPSLSCKRACPKPAAKAAGQGQSPSQDRGEFRAAGARPCQQGLAVRGGAQGVEPAEAHPEADRRHHLRDRLRPVGPAAYRHVRRGGPHHHGAPRLPRADRGQDPDPADLFLGRHGRLAQGARQRPQQGDAGRASRQAADPGAGPVRRAPKLRPSQQCATEVLSRHVRVRLRVPVGHRLLHLGPLRRRPCSRCWRITTRSAT